AAQVADHFIEGDLMSPESAARLARVAGAITVEIENVSVPGLEAAACEVPVRPSAAVVRIAQHRLAEKQALEAMGVPLAPFREVTGAAQLREALESIGFPAILKTARGGYDGKGQVRIADPGQVERAFEELGAGRVDLVVEAVVPFEKEISVVVARDAAGRIAAYPVVENEHRRGILHRSIAPARAGTHVRERAMEERGVCRWYVVVEAVVPLEKDISVVVARDAAGRIAAYPVVENEHRRGILHRSIAPARVGTNVRERAVEAARDIAEGLGLVGVLAVEMFALPGGEIVVNELAPRPHNSGHFTLDACATSQFEQAIRAVAGLGLGSTEQLVPAVMLNILGEHLPA